MIQTALIASAEARRRSEAGMQRVRDAVEREVPGYMATAVDAVRRFAAQQSRPFTAEAARIVLEPELPHTDRKRCWGPVFQAAARKGFIKPTGRFAPAASSNAQPMRLWVKGDAHA